MADDPYDLRGLELPEIDVTRVRGVVTVLSWAALVASLGGIALRHLVAWAVESYTLLTQRNPK